MQRPQEDPLDNDDAIARHPLNKAALVSMQDLGISEQWRAPVKGLPERLCKGSTKVRRQLLWSIKLRRNRRKCCDSNHDNGDNDDEDDDHVHDHDDK